MLTIRDTQLKVLRADVVARFVTECARAAASRFPEEFQRQGEAAFFEWVRNGCDRAAGYGIETQRDILSFLEQMVLLGDDFDSNPRLSWAGRILNSTGVDGYQKTRLLCAQSERIRRIKARH